MLKLLEKLGNCVQQKVKSTHPSNTSGGLGLSRRLKLVTRRCSRRTIPSSEQTKDERRRLPPTPKSSGKGTAQMSSRYQIIAKATGIPLKTVKTIYNRGLAAWRTGHRVGASPQAWGYARVHSFATKGKTYYTADANLRK